MKVSVAGAYWRGDEKKNKQLLAFMEHRSKTEEIN
jgi:hypothetical protein